MDLVGDFCQENGLTVSIENTKCMVIKGKRGCNEVDGSLQYQGKMVEIVEQFKYLGLEFNQFFYLSYVRLYLNPNLANFDTSIP